MCDIKLFVYLTIDYTISGNIFVFILKLRLQALQGYLIQADICSMDKDIGRKLQVISEDEKKHARLTSK